jgi:signal peptidase I
MLPDTGTYPGAEPLRILTEPGRRVRGRVSATTAGASALLAGVVLLILIAIAGMIIGAWRFTVIDTGSMRPTLNPGDVVVLGSEPIADLTPGQIVAFHPPGEPRLTVMHRVFSIHRLRNGVIIQTKGDANNATDPWHARITSNTVWREELKLSTVGYLVAWSQQRTVRLGVLIVIMILVVSMLLGCVWRPVTHRER